MNRDTVGSYWVDEDNVVWQQVSYTDEPTASLRRADDHSQRLSGVVGSLVLSKLRLLTPSEPQE